MSFTLKVEDDEVAMIGARTGVWTGADTGAICTGTGREAGGGAITLDGTGAVGIGAVGNGICGGAIGIGADKGADADTGATATGAIAILPLLFFKLFLLLLLLSPVKSNSSSSS